MDFPLASMGLCPKNKFDDFALLLADLIVTQGLEGEKAAVEKLYRIMMKSNIEALDRYESVRVRELYEELKALRLVGCR